MNANITREALAVLREFTEDIEAAYIHKELYPGSEALAVLRYEWPDLAVTYEKALAVLAKVSA